MYGSAHFSTLDLTSLPVPMWVTKTAICTQLRHFTQANSQSGDANVLRDPTLIWQSGDREELDAALVETEQYVAHSWQGNNTRQKEHNRRRLVSHRQFRHSLLDNDRRHYRWWPTLCGRSDSALMGLNGHQKVTRESRT